MSPCRSESTSEPPACPAENFTGPRNVKRSQQVSPGIGKPGRQSHANGCRRHWAANRTPVARPATLQARTLRASTGLPPRSRAENPAEIAKKQEAPVGVEPTMADLQSAALATWLRRLETHSSRTPIVKYAGCISQAEQAETTDSTRRPIFSAFDAPLFNESRSPHSFPNCCEQWRPAIPGDTFLCSCFPFRFRSRPASHSP